MYKYLNNSTHSFFFLNHHSLFSLSHENERGIRKNQIKQKQKNIFLKHNYPLVLTLVTKERGPQKSSCWNYCQLTFQDIELMWKLNVLVISLHPPVFILFLLNTTCRNILYSLRRRRRRRKKQNKQKIKTSSTCRNSLDGGFE